MRLTLVTPKRHCSHRDFGEIFTASNRKVEAKLVTMKRKSERGHESEYLWSGALSPSVSLTLLESAQRILCRLEERVGLQRN